MLCKAKVVANFQIHLRYTMAKKVQIKYRGKEKIWHKKRETKWEKKIFKKADNQRVKKRCKIAE